MLLRFALHFSLSLFGAGLVYKVVSWFRCSIGDQSRGISPARRFSSAVRGLTAVLFSRRLLLLGKIFFRDVLLQLRLKKEGALRWFMHLTLFYGFLFLLFFHALDRHITIRLFPEYVSTLNPFLFLRNFFGALLLLGLAIAAYRRFRDPVLRLTIGQQDIFALVLLGVIVLFSSTRDAFVSKFETLVEITGGISVDWPLRLQCCGHPLRDKNEPLSLELMRKKNGVGPEGRGGCALRRLSPLPDAVYPQTGRLDAGKRLGPFPAVPPLSAVAGVESGAG